MYFLALVKNKFFLYYFIKCIVNFFFHQNWIMQSIHKCVLVTMYFSFMKCQHALILFKMQKKQSSGLETHDPLLAQFTFGLC